MVEKTRPLLHRLETRSTDGVDTTLAKLLSPDLNDWGLVTALRGCVHCPRQVERYWEQHYNCSDHDVWTFDVSRNIRAIILESLTAGKVPADIADTLLDLLRSAVGSAEMHSGSCDDEDLLNRFIDVDKLRTLKSDACDEMCDYTSDDSDSILSGRVCSNFVPCGKLEGMRSRLVAQNNVLADDVTFAIRNWAMLLMPLENSTDPWSSEKCGSCAACWLHEMLHVR